ncbi:MAG: hypothetical protein GXO69_00585 [Acidobacteria bacterium]|nr:hypothetical protein [Acidobacteriota bacterium]
MKKTIVFALFFLPLQLLAADGFSCRIPDSATPAAAFSILQKSFSSIAKNELNFKNIQSNAKLFTIGTEERSFKLRRRTPKIGKFPEMHRPKWKKEKIRFTADIKDRVLTVSLHASAYNRRGRKWYPVQSTGRYEEDVIDSVLTRVIQGIHGQTMGSPTAVTNGQAHRLKNLQPYTVTNAYISLRGVKKLVVDLSDKSGTIWKISIPYLGPINNTCTAVRKFFSMFTTKNIRAGVPKIYDYYWAYAENGEIMDGMYDQQVRTALGTPDSIIKKGKNKEEWIYRNDEGSYTLTMINHELNLPDNSGS